MTVRAGMTQKCVNPNNMKTLSIIIPAYNEEKTIGTVLEKVITAPLGGWERDIIVVNDGSQDKTEHALAPYKNEITYISHEKNRGKGAAIRSALPHVRGDAVLIQDADLEYHLEDIPALLSKLEHARVHAVYGSRNIHPERRGYRHYVLGAQILTTLVNLCFGSKLTDSYTCYKLIRTPALKELNLKSNGFEYEMEVTAQLLKRGYTIKEVPIRYSPRSFKDGKKIRTRDGVKGIITLLKSLR